jgi:hypothetical protein
MKEFRDHACHKSNNNGPKNAHWPLPLSCVLAPCEPTIMARLVHRNLDLNQTNEARRITFRNACMRSTQGEDVLPTIGRLPQCPEADTAEVL